jgi:hypothetical protein
LLTIMLELYQYPPHTLSRSYLFPCHQLQFIVSRAFPGPYYFAEESIPESMDYIGLSGFVFDDTP